MTPIAAYLEKGVLPDDKIEAIKLRQRAARYVMYDQRLYRRSFSQPLLKCIDGEDCDYILHEVHGGICGNHTGGNSLVLKIMRQGYYWPTLRQDAFAFAKKCDKCQRIATYTHQPSNNGKQFNCKEMRQLCDDLGIKKAFSAIAYPQSNRQTEVVNKKIKHTIKGKLEERKGT
ncbi:uncharacterized protein LOC133031403 [Cannabis sativa]|uniref:uncharacterized protein LOC133031403 n=1 Tax=Cannabis sativa TaxID=3483 RepID=UPI0029CA38AF|nr:uncharacterized protein LOC133031403 [Cannabis sativa]